MKDAEQDRMKCTQSRRFKFCERSLRRTDDLWRFDASLAMLEWQDKVAAADRSFLQ
jgi:hypothetical protein